MLDTRKVVYVSENKCTAEPVRKVAARRGIGLEWLQTARIHSKLVLEFRVILLEVDLSTCSGVDLIRKSRRSFSLSSFIAITPSPRNPIVQLAIAMQNNAFAFFAKPLDHDELLDTVESAFERLKRWNDVLHRVDVCNRSTEPKHVKNELFGFKS